MSHPCSIAFQGSPFLTIYPPYLIFKTSYNMTPANCVSSIWGHIFKKKDLKYLWNQIASCAWWQSWHLRFDEIWFLVLGLATGHLFLENKNSHFVVLWFLLSQLQTFVQTLSSVCVLLALCLPLYIRPSSEAISLKNALFTIPAGNNFPFESSAVFFAILAAHIKYFLLV